MAKKFGQAAALLAAPPRVCCSATGFYKSLCFLRRWRALGIEKTLTLLRFGRYERGLTSRPEHVHCSGCQCLRQFLPICAAANLSQEASQAGTLTIPGEV